MEQSPSESAHSRQAREGWTDLAWLLAAAVDKLEVLAWMQTDDAAKGRNRPEPIPRPGVKPSKDRARMGTGSFETPDDLAAWYAGRFN